MNERIGIVFRKDDKTKCDAELNKQKLLFQMLRIPFNLRFNLIDGVHPWMSRAFRVSIIVQSQHDHFQQPN